MLAHAFPPRRSSHLWVWGGGWLATMGVMDFAGALVVHLSAGFSALALVLVAGRRRAASAGHAPVLGIAGGLLLWIGWAGLLGGWWSGQRRVGIECVGTCGSRWAPVT